MEENELFGEAHEQEENGLFGRMHQAEQLNLCGVVDTLVCDIVKGTRCKDSFANYRDGVCYVCGGQAN